MFLSNQHPDYGRPLEPVDAETLGVAASAEVERYLTHRDNHAPTPLRTLPALAAALGIGALHRVEVEGFGVLARRHRLAKSPLALHEPSFHGFS